VPDRTVPLVPVVLPPVVTPVVVLVPVLTPGVSLVPVVVRLTLVAFDFLVFWTFFTFGAVAVSPAPDWTVVVLPCVAT